LFECKIIAKEIEMKDILLISPNTLGSYRSANIKDENLALGYLAAALGKNGYRVEIIDARMENVSPESAIKRVKKRKPFFIGISMISEESVFWVEKFGKGLKRAEYIKHICAGGYYPSLQPKEVLHRLSFVDSVANGEGELTIVDLVQRVESDRRWKHINGITVRISNKTVRTNRRRSLIANLDDLPQPVHYGNQDSTEILIEGSRGCFGGCNFCAVGPHLRATPELSWRGRSPESIVSEILMLRKLFPDNCKYRFIDPDFFGSSSKVHSERTLRLASLIEKESLGIEIYVEARVADINRKDVLVALKRAGLKEVYLGVESGSNRILKLMNKHVSAERIVKTTQLLEELQINYQYGHMMVTPWTEYKDVVCSLVLLRKIGRVQFDKLFNELYIIPGTDLMRHVAGCYKLIKEKGTGYYSYEMGFLVKNIRTLGSTFENSYRDFSEEVWFLYKDVQRHEQCNVDGATIIQQRLSTLFIEIFEFCLERSRKKLLSKREIREIVEEAIISYQDRISSIRKLLDPLLLFKKTT
jgi:radical SAM superfamily enzyme YgiQ (UPF0313 family)